MLLGQMHGTMTNRGTIWRVGSVQAGGEAAGGGWEGEWRVVGGSGGVGAG